MYEMRSQFKTSDGHQSKQNQGFQQPVSKQATTFAVDLSGSSSVYFSV